MLPVWVEPTAQWAANTHDPVVLCSLLQVDLDLDVSHRVLPPDTRREEVRFLVVDRANHDRESCCCYSIRFRGACKQTV